TDAPRNHRLGARWSALMKGTWLKGDERRDVLQIAIHLTEGHGFRMWLIGWLRKAAGDDRSLANEDASHRRGGQARRQGHSYLRHGLTHECFEGLATLAHVGLAFWPLTRLSHDLLETLSRW